MKKRRWLWMLAVLVVLAVVAAYGIPKVSERLGIDLVPWTNGAADSDGDGLRDDVEKSGWTTEDGVEYRTDPGKADTDGDGLSDGDEAGDSVDVASGSDGLQESEAAAEQAAFVGLSNPLLKDTDGDGLDDAEEADLSLNPFAGDSDGDGIEDGREVHVVGTAPDVADTDGDGFDDGFEDANREKQGLDPLWVDTRVSKWTYAADYAKGAIAGDLWREDSMAWLAGNLTSGASSSIPVIGTVVGGAADLRDAVGSAIHADWVGSGFSVVGAVPGGDAVAIPAKVSEFVARNPQLAAVVAASIAAMPKISEENKFRAIKAATPGAGDLVGAGASKRAVLQLSGGRTNLDRVAAATERSGFVGGTTSKFLPAANSKLKPGPAGEKALENELRKLGVTIGAQVVASTKSCRLVCNAHNRRFDVVADGVAHESKVGHVPWSPAVERQIRSDAFLIKAGNIKGAQWHFYPSSVSNTLGADPKVLDVLDELKIPYTVHLPR